MRDLQCISIAIALVGCVWAYVWDQKHKRDVELFRAKLEHDTNALATVRSTMATQASMVNKLSKPPTLPGDEWKTGDDND